MPVTPADLMREAVAAGLTGRPTCWLCAGAGDIQTGGHCTHGLRRRGEDDPCSEECVRTEPCPACGGIGIKEAPKA